jgi:uncharacterized cupin superfamily protein
VRRVNLFSPTLDDDLDHDGFGWRRARIGAQLGAERIGGSLYDVPEGKKNYPYHFHHGMEEWAIVVSGTPVLRAPDGERQLRAGDIVCFPAGQEGAHQFRGPGYVLILSTNRSPETIEYPDSGKFGALPPGGIFRMADKVDYWEGE